jgi:hypothetical protein
MRSSPAPADLSSGYAELKRIDHALRDAEQRLHDAHIEYSHGKGPRPDGHYQEVIVLRQLSRSMLDGLAQLFLARD